MYIGEILRRGTQNLSYIRWSLIGFCVILSTPVDVVSGRDCSGSRTVILYAWLFPDPGYPIRIANKFVGSVSPSVRL